MAFAPPKNYEVLRGFRHFRGKVYKFEDHFYQKNKQYKDQYYLACTLKVTNQCPGTSLLNVSTGVMLAKRLHNHGTDEYPRGLELKNAIKHAAEENLTLTSKKYIFDDMTRGHVDAAFMSFPQLERAMHRAGAKMRPKIPTDAEEFSQMLDLPTASAYSTNFRVVVEHSGQYAVIFISESMLLRLPNVKDIFYDATFWVVPDSKLFPEVHPGEEEERLSDDSSEEEYSEPEAGEGRTGHEEAVPVRRCVVCLQENLDLERVYVFLPCGHSRTCQRCGDELIDRNAHCPECRSRIVTRHVIYI